MFLCSQGNINHTGFGLFLLRKAFVCVYSSCKCLLPVDKVHKRRRICFLEYLLWNIAQPPVGPSVPSAGHQPPASPWNQTNNLSITAPGQKTTRATQFPQNRYADWCWRWFSTTLCQQRYHSFIMCLWSMCIMLIIIIMCLTCAAPGSASPGPASCPAGGWAPVWAVSLTSGAPTPAGSVSSDRSDSCCACEFPAPDAGSGSSPAHREAF